MEKKLMDESILRKEKVDLQEERSNEYI